MSGVFVRGIGAVSPAGWGAGALLEALAIGLPIPTTILPRPGCDPGLRVRAVPKRSVPLRSPAHARLRRVSPVSQYAVAAAIEALGPDAVRVENGELRLGIVVCVFPGCVTYSRRFCQEVQENPSTASPLLFPETVFHAPASHLAACLNSASVTETLVGDESCFLQGLALAGRWLTEDQVDRCVVIGAEEMDWIVADAAQLFDREAIHSEGAGALYLTCADHGETLAELDRVTNAFPFLRWTERARAAQAMRNELGELPPGGALLCESRPGLARLDAAEKNAWHDWPGKRLALKLLLGDAFTASAAWQCVAACHNVQSGRFESASVSVVGINQQAIGARFVRRPEPSR